ncbi:bacterioferritin [Gilvimarinus agarilyticus]|uniref:ferritin-like domain-containing protein n=1 Tax=unclassified Gilvimarinus TaxID=2642066 RepID=UPI001C0820B5|nr:MULTISPECIES: ferritin-like domain-containing protein [unclassified Gilvimarinus]MBU2887876.1 bacterioferritin [Gilvimarinus agarilyticus]MDO6572514.1 ferritin-like domain-containing protein [Gilvimarinus sp. 2_MG-2023]MDO6746653.1 ferritin-like domain-containing protein [Gilvimarinus sp. 1_MG-2023]
MTQTAFIHDLQARKQKAKQHMMRGAVTEDYTNDREVIVKMLNEALATELICVLRYKVHHFTANGRGARDAAVEFLEHAQEEQEHADKLAERISQLGAEPEMNPSVLAERSHSDYHSGGDTIEMLKEDLVAERIAISSYREMIQYIGDKDPTTRRLLEDLLAQEEEHADDLVDLLEHIGADV